MLISLVHLILFDINVLHLVITIVLLSPLYLVLSDNHLPHPPLVKDFISVFNLVLSAV